MKSVLLIGAGKFGQALGEKLLSMGNEVMVVDKDDETINSLASKYTNALITNCMNVENLKALDIPSFDACVIAITDDFQSSLEITSLVKDLGAKYVVSKANTDIQRKFLLRVGADEVVYPYLDTAEKLAVKLNSQKVFDYIELSPEYSVFEIAVPQKWIGKTLVSLNPRKRYGINVLSIKNDKTLIPSPEADYVFREGDHMVVFGNTKTILSFSNSNK